MFETNSGAHCANEALHLGLVVVIGHAGTDERVQSERWWIRSPRYMLFFVTGKDINITSTKGFVVPAGGGRARPEEGAARQEVASDE
jgi:hypothetical protein